MVEPARKWHLNTDLMNPGRWAENYFGTKTNTDKKPPERTVELISAFKQQSLHHEVCRAYAVRIICQCSREIGFWAIFLINVIHRGILKFLNVLPKLLTVLRVCVYKSLTRCVMHRTRNVSPASPSCKETCTCPGHKMSVVCETW